MSRLLQIFMGFIAITLVTSNSRDPHKLTAVSDSIIAEAVYYRMRKLEPEPALKETVHPDEKKRMCHYITGSAYFATQVERVPLHELFDDLQVHEKEIFDKLYEKAGDDDQSASIDGQDMIYKNPTRPISVSSPRVEKLLRFGKAISEYAFLCLSVGRKNDTVQHYVSREYDVSDDNDESNATKTGTAGRFIFADRGYEISIFGLAEEPATTLSTPGSAVEEEYLRRTVDHGPARENSGDSLCSLNKHQRLRVCTIVMNAAHFVGELIFTPKYDRIDEFACFCHKISFENEPAKSASSGKEYYEFTIRCKPELYYASYQTEYFVSRAYASNEVFVYRWSSGRSTMLVDNLFGNVRFEVADIDDLVLSVPMEEDKRSGKRLTRDGIVKELTPDVEDASAEKKPKIES